jgi:transcriptional regulator with XRE-family HTH domain
MEGRKEIDVTPAQLKSIRLALGLSLSQMGRALGYAGTRQNASTQVYRLETGRRPIGPQTAMAALHLASLKPLRDRAPEL